MRPEDFGRLALPMLDSLYRTARRLSDSEADAEDLVQQTYLEACRSCHRLRSPSSCRAWLFTILRNLWREALARRYKRPMLALVDVEPLLAEESLEPAIIARAFSDETEHALRALPEEFRIAVLLADVEGLSYEEIAQVMDCPEGTVRSRLARGRALLATRLGRGAGVKRKEGRR
jgi:RNA polymerase sigma-70 factor (ECF subfamily)